MQVGKFYEIRRRMFMLGGGVADRDFTYDRFFMNEMLWMGGNFNADWLMSRTISWSLADQMKQYSLIDISKRFVEPKHQLIVYGHDPLTPVYCELWVTVPDQDLFEDPWVRQWIGAKAKQNIGKQLGTFTVQLLGGVTVNQNTYVEEGKTEEQECKDFFKTIVDSNQFMLTTP